MKFTIYNEIYKNLDIYFTNKVADPMPKMKMAFIYNCNIFTKVISKCKMNFRKVDMLTWASILNRMDGGGVAFHITFKLFPEKNIYIL